MNNITIVGRLTKDVETRVISDNAMVANMTVAVNRHDGEADFFICETWNKQAENCGTYLEKGSQVAINGRMQQETFEVDGVKQYRWKLKIQTIDFLNSPKKDTPAEKPKYNKYSK